MTTRATLAPSAITLRRPSGQADQILTRVDGKDHPSPAISPSDSVHSAPLYGYGARTPCGQPDSGSESTSRSLSRASSPSGSFKEASASSPATPDRRRRQLCRRLQRVKDDLERLGHGLRKAGGSFRGSLENILYRLSPTSTRRKVIQQANGLTVEIIRDSDAYSGRRRTSSVEDDFVCALDVPDHNFSTSLLLKDLYDGQFRAEIPMDKFPAGQVTIRIRNYKLEILVVRRIKGQEAVDKSHRVTRPYYCGSINIPIYVNPSTLEFELDESGKTLRIRGRMKGCGTEGGSDDKTGRKKKISASAQDLRLPSPLPRDLDLFRGQSCNSVYLP